MQLFDFTPAQLQLLDHIARVEAGKKLELSFENPAEDQRVMRRAIYLDGGLQMLQYLLDFDDNLRREKEKEKGKLVDAVPAENTAVLPQPNLDF